MQYFKLIFNILEKQNTIAIATVKHYFLSLCIIFFQKKCKEKKNNLKKNYKIIKIIKKK
jgi:hypothetical protein